TPGQGIFTKGAPMRVHARILAVFLVAASAAAQTTSSSSGTSSSSPEQTAGQNPTSPLEEPKKPTEAEQNKPQASKFNVAEQGASGQDQQLGEIRLTTRWTEVGGDQSRSFRVSPNEI